MGHEKRAGQEQMRKQRIDLMVQSAHQLAAMLVRMAPAHAVSIAFTMAAEKQGSENPPWTKAECRVVSAWTDPDTGAAHLARISDIANDQHVDLQKQIDEFNEKQREMEASAAALAENPPGVAVEGHLEEKGTDGVNDDAS